MIFAPPAVLAAGGAVLLYYYTYIIYAYIDSPIDDIGQDIKIGRNSPGRFISRSTVKFALPTCPLRLGVSL